MYRIEDFEPLLEGEKTLLAGLSSGEFVPIGGTEVPPEGAGEARQIRGAFLRYLLLGGCDGLEGCGDHKARVHEKGVRIAGARITGVLDLEGCRIPRDMALIYCRFDAAPVLRSARIDNVFLNGSVLPGMRADRLDAKGSVILRGVHSDEAIRLHGARLGGVLDFDGAELKAGDGKVALSADGLDVKGDVFLRGVRSDGAIRLLGAKLGGSLVCDGAELKAGDGEKTLSADRLDAKGSVFLRGVHSDGEIRLLGAKLGGDLSCIGADLKAGNSGWALHLQGAEIGGGFFLRGGAKIFGLLDLTGARIAELVDEADSWPGSGDLILNRCRYGAFTGRASVTAEARLKWLGLQDPARFGQDFWPQPWEQCAKVLREMGHAGEARKILIDKEKRQRADRRKRLRRAHLYEDAYWFGLWDWVLGKTVRYGHVPLLAFAYLAAFWLAGAVIFNAAANHDAIKPNEARVLRSPEWAFCHPDYDGIKTRRMVADQSHLDCFLEQPEAKSYPKFNPWIYSVDTLLPIVAMEMQGYWIPDDRANRWGVGARWFLWLQIAMGWALSLLAVAGFSGLVKSDSGKA